MNDVQFAIPGNGRSLSRDEINAIYGANVTRPIPPGYTKKRTYAQRVETMKFLPFAVYKVFDSGAKEFKSQHRTEQDAINAAGKARDEMTDGECGKDFTFLAQRHGRQGVKK